MLVLGTVPRALLPQVDALRFLEDRTGIVVEELRPGMLPERPDVPAPRLF